MRFAIALIAVLPNPRRSGAQTEGPRRSIQLILEIVGNPSADVDMTGICRKSAAFDSTRSHALSAVFSP
jgi:hypothetical protein